MSSGTLVLLGSFRAEVALRQPPNLRTIQEAGLVGIDASCDQIRGGPGTHEATIGEWTIRRTAEAGCATPSHHHAAGAQDGGG